MSFDEWKKQYRVQMPKDLRIRVYDALDEQGHVAVQPVRKKNVRRRIAGIGSAVAAIVIACIFVSNINTIQHRDNNGLYQGSVSTGQGNSNSQFESFTLSPAQIEQIRSVQAANKMENTTIYIPSKMPTGSQMGGVQFGIQGIHGVTSKCITVEYTNFDITFGSSKFVPTYSPAIRTVKVNGVVAKWHKSHDVISGVPSPGEKHSVQYIFEFTLGATHVEFTTMLQNTSMADIEYIAQHLVSLQ